MNDRPGHTAAPDAALALLDWMPADATGALVANLLALAGGGGGSD
jgi:hypothetical protein